LLIISIPSKGNISKTNVEIIFGIWHLTIMQESFTFVDIANPADPIHHFLINSSEYSIYQTY